MENFSQVYRIGTARSYGGRAYSIFVKAEFKDGRLSISGVEGPTHGGNCIGACGQIDMHLKPEDVTPAPGWTTDSIARLLAIWDKWHLNDMKAGCEHQDEAWDVTKKIMVTKFGWTTEYHQLSKKAQEGKLSAEEYTTFAEIAKRVYAATIETDRPAYNTQEVDALLTEGWIKVDKTEEKATGWVRESEHPEGLLSKACEVCGHKYGHSWLKREVPEEVLQELKDFPKTDREPAWV